MPPPGPPSAFEDHFLHPRGQGDLPDATHRGEATDPACGDWLELALRVEAGTITAARFRVRGCSGAIAVGSALTTLLPGRAAQPGALVDSDLDAALGGVPRLKRHCLRLALAALDQALRTAPP